MAQDIENKRTVLDDDAAIYQTSGDRNEKNSTLKKFSTLSGEEKKQYFKDYMLKPIIIGVIAVVLIVGFIISSFSNSKSIAFRISSLSPYYLEDKDMNELADLLSNYWQLDKKEVVSYTTGIGRDNFVTHMTAGTLDIVIGEKSELEQYGHMFTDFNEVEDEIKSIIPEDALCELTYTYMDKNGNDIETTTKSAIYVKDTVLKDLIGDDLPNVDRENLVIVVNAASLSEKEERGYYKADFIKYLFGEIKFD